MFIPATPEEIRSLGWDRLDVILVTGDSYMDSPFVGVALIGKWLLKAGYRVGIIAQPDVDSSRDITRLGEPLLFWGVTGGCIDSLVANRTALNRRRRRDDYTAGGVNDRRPDRAVIVYANLIRRCFKDTAPIVLGGIEASLRRIAHYDFWSDRIRRSVLVDAKADLLVYGMAERTILLLAHRLRTGRDFRDLRGLCYLDAAPKEESIVLPSFAEVAGDKKAFEEMFLVFLDNQDHKTARCLSQRQNGRWLIHNPPAEPLAEAEMDEVYGMEFRREAHPLDAQRGQVRALETIRFSLATHRGCYGDCHFCAIAVHEGRTISCRSEESILREARVLAELPDFKGYILDVGGPTANMYGIECQRKLRQGVCRDKRCLFPRVCPSLRPDHRRQLDLLVRLRHVRGVKQASVASGIRYDLVLADRRYGLPYLRELVSHHISGQMKVAPEHSVPEVLSCMGKPPIDDLLAFRDAFRRLSEAAGKKQYLTYYFIAAHPGCTMRHMELLRNFASRELAIIPEQAQVFTPLPSTISALMYYTGRDPFSGRPLFVERGAAARERQKQILVAKSGLIRYGEGRSHYNRGEKTMAKDKDKKKETKKKPSKTLKEKKEAKKAKKAGKEA